MSDGTGPAERAAFLRGLDAEAERRGAPARGGDGGFLQRLSEAEQLVEQTERDWDEASYRVRWCRANAPGHEFAASRHLNPDQRHAYVELLGAEETEREAERAYTAARSRLNQMLSEYEEVWTRDPGPISEEWRKPWQ